MREYWVENMLKIADPVLRHLAKGTLHKSIPKDFHKDRKNFILLEAFGRTACGIAPWLECELPQGKEKDLQTEYRNLMHKCIVNATNPLCPDYMNWCHCDRQPLVDCAFLAHAVLRAPNSMYFSLDEKTQKRFATCLKKSRKIKPWESNWLFFSAMVETGLYVMGAKYDLTPVDYAIEKFKKWYVGDGTYGDGNYFHWDYYNSYVIHPMFLDLLKVFSEIRPDYKELYEIELKRASRYTKVLEQLINADGTYAVFGRSSVYRFGAFQLLSQAVLQEFLPDELTYSQVRCGLNAVIHKVMENEQMFDHNGWLLPGVYGHQPDMAEEYINVGSLYLCETVFLPLGLHPDHKFWTEKDKPWTSKKIWSGESTIRDHSID